MSEMVEAATEFRKNGFNDDDAAQLGQVATMFQNVSDEAISAGESAGFIIAQLTAFGDSMSGFNTEAEKAQHVIDAVNEVANSFSVSSGDLANNLGNMSAVMSQTGASFEQSLAMLTSITEVTRSASKASRGLVSIGSRLNSVVDESSSNGKALKEIYEGLNIALFDQEGQLRSSFDVFSDLAEIWPSLDKNTQNYIASIQAGTNQFQNFAALMQNFDTALEATEVALNSTGSAANENAAYMESLEARTSALKATFQDLANNVISNELVSSILTLADAFLQLLNTPIGTFVTQVTLLTGALFGLQQLMRAMNIFGTIGSQIKNLGTAFSSLIGVINGTTTAATAMSSVMNAAFPLIGILTTAIVGVPAIIDAVTVTLEEQREIVQQIETELQNVSQEYDNLNNKEYKSSADLERLSILEKQRDVLKEQYQLEKQREFEMTFKETGLGDFGEISTGTEDFERYIDTLEEAKEKAKYFADEIAKVDTKSESAADTIAELKKQQDKWNEVAIEAEEGASAMALKLLDYKDAGIEVGQELRNLLNRYSGVEAKETELIQTTQGYAVATNDTTIEVSNLELALAQVSTGMGIGKAAADSLRAAYPNLQVSLDATTGKFYVQTGAINDAAIAGENWAIALINASDNARVQVIASLEAIIAAYEATLSSMSGKVLMGEELNTYMTTLDALQTSRTFLTTLKLSNRYTPYKSYSSGYTPKPTPTGGTTTTNRKEETKEKEKEVDIIEEQSKAFDEQNAIMEHNIYLREQQGASEEELIKLNQQYQNELHKQAEWYRGQGLDDTSEYIRDTQKQWWELQETIEGYEGDITENARDNFDSRLQMYDDYISDRNDLDDWGADSEIKTYQRMLAWMDEQYAQGLIDYEYYVEQRAEKAHELAVLEKEAEEQAFEDARNAFDNRLEISKNYIQDRNDLGDWGADNEIAAYERVLAWMDEWYAQGLIDYEYYWENRNEIAKQKIIAEKQYEQELIQNNRDAFDERLEISKNYIKDRNDFDDWGADSEIQALQRVLDWMDEWYKQGLIDYEYYWDQRVQIAREQALLEKQQMEEQWREQKEAQIDAVEERQKALETLFSLVADKAQEEIDILEAQKEEINNRYQAQIDALKEVNDELDDQIEKEEALDNLARARQTQVMVYKDGRFQYVQDIDQVSEAQANLEKLKREEVLEKETQKLEELRDKEIASIDEQIEYWEKYKEEWSSVVDDYDEEQDRLLVLQELGIDLEGENWETRLGNLSNYITQYKSLMAELAALQEQLNQGLQPDESLPVGDSVGGSVGGGTGIKPGSGSLAGTEYNAWAWVPGSGYVPVTVENGHTVQTGLPEGTIIYGDAGAWKITGGEGGDKGYTSEYIGSTPSNIWTPGKETSSSGGVGSSSGGGGSGGSGTGITPGSGSLAGTQNNAWAWVPGSGYVPVTVEGGKTQQWGLPEGTIIYGDEDAWIITGGGTQNGEGYTSEYYGKTPDNIWTPNKGSSDASDTRPSAPAWNTGGGGGSSSRPSSGSSSSTSGNRPGNSPSAAGNYSRKYASGTLSASGGLSLVGEEGPELRVLNSGDGILPSGITKNLMDIGKYSARDLLNGGSNGTVVHIASLTLPGIKDSQEFIKYFNSSLWRKTLQYKTSMS